MTNYTLNKTYEVISLSGGDTEIKILNTHLSYYIRDDNNKLKI